MVNKGQDGEESVWGKQDYARAALMAEKCPDFIIDDEDEQVTEEPRSCYNCRFRRWTVQSFTCTKGSIKNF